MDRIHVPPIHIPDYYLNQNETFCPRHSDQNIYYEYENNEYEPENDIYNIMSFVKKMVENIKDGKIVKYFVEEKNKKRYDYFIKREDGLWLYFFEESEIGGYEHEYKEYNEYNEYQEYQEYHSYDECYTYNNDYDYDISHIIQLYKEYNKYRIYDQYDSQLIDFIKRQVDDIIQVDNNLAI